MIGVTTRCRVDLAGGTLDIWPIGLLHPGAATVNVAIEVPVGVRLQRSEDGFRVRQLDRELRASSVDELLSNPAWALVGWVARHLELPPSSIEIESRSPHGAGLGASSALAVALLAAGEILRHGRLVESALRRAAIARDLEARLMGLPTGIQDHLPAQQGGALSIEHRPGGETCRSLDVDLEGLSRHWVVAYTGQSHFSAGNNWSVLRRRFEGDPEIIRRFDRIRDVALELPQALEAGDWETAGRLVADEWQSRRGLAPEVSTPRLEELLTGALEAGAWGGKACGAGGGGCVVALAPAQRVSAVADLWTRSGARVLDAPATRCGIEVFQDGE